MLVLPTNVDWFSTPLTSVQIFGRLKRRGIRPDAVSYTTLITALAAMDRFTETRRVFDSMQRDKAVAVDLAAYSAMAASLSKEGDMPAARALLTQATEAAKAVGQRPPVQAYGAVIAGYAKQRDLESALDLVKEFYQEVRPILLTHKAPHTLLRHHTPPLQFPHAHFAPPLHRAGTRIVACLIPWWSYACDLASFSARCRWFARWSALGNRQTNGDSRRCTMSCTGAVTAWWRRRTLVVWCGSAALRLSGSSFGLASRIRIMAEISVPSHDIHQALMIMYVTLAVAAVGV